MTAYEIIMIILTVMSSMMNFCMAIIALPNTHVFAYIESRHKYKK